MFLLDGGNVAAEVVNGQLTATYLRGANLISRNEEYYLFNAHGDVVNLTSASGAVTRTYAYDAFGNEKNPDETDTNPFRYCGEYFDGETGTYYLRARYYDPAVGRFTQQDTHWNVSNMIYGDNPQKISEREDALGLKTYTYAPQISAIMQSGNLYVYCINDPCFYQDITGEAAINAVFAAIGAVAGWAVGDCVAKELGLNDGWQYWAVRASVTAGAATLGWFAGVGISRVAATYLTKNPSITFKLASTLGGSGFVSAMEFMGIDPFSLTANSGKFIGLVKTVFNNPAVQIGADWAKTVIQKAQEFGYSIRLDAGHIGTRWEGIYHLNIGKYHLALDEEAVETVKQLLEAE